MAVAAAGQLLPQAGDFWQQILRATGAFALYPALLAATGFLNREERKQIGALWARLTSGARPA